MIILEVKFELNVNKLIGEISNCENVILQLQAGEPLDTQSQDFSKGNLTDTNEESGCDEKNEYIKRKCHWQNILGDTSQH